MMWFWLLPALGIGGFAAGWWAMIRMLRQGIREEREVQAIHDLRLRAPTDAVFLEEMKRHPRSVQPTLGWIESAVSAGNYDEALRRAEMSPRRFRNHPHVLQAKIRIRLFQRDYAAGDALLSAAMRRFPDHIGFYELWVTSAEWRADYALALSRSAEVRRARPKISAAYFGSIRAYLQQGKFDEAAAIMAPAYQQLEGRHEQLVLSRFSAQIAEGQGHTELALQRWADVITADANDVDAYLATIRLLRALSRHDEADDILKRASIRFPDNLAVAELAAQGKLQDLDVGSPPG